MSGGLFPEKLKRSRYETRRIGDLHYKDSKTRKGNVPIAWIDNKKAYDIILKSRIIDSKCIRYPSKFNREHLKNWRVE